VSATFTNFQSINRPTIVTQPVGITAIQGTPASLSVEAVSPPEGLPLRYQWFFGSTRIAGATSSTYTFDPTPALAGNYTVEVRNSAGAVVSDPPVAVEVWVPATVSVEPATTTVACGAAQASFSVTAAGDEPITYQWQLNGVDILNEVNPTLVVLNPSVANANLGPYRVVVSNHAGTNTSAAAYIQLSDTVAPTVFCPDNMSVQCGTPVIFTATAIANACGYAFPVVCVPPSASAFPVGVTTVNCTATDPLSGAGTCSFTVTVADTVAPVIAACQGNISVTETGVTTVVTWPDMTANDACQGSVAVVCIPASGTGFATGNTIVSCTATDTNNNTSSPCTFTVTVESATRPSLTITVQDPMIRISWPMSAAGYVLQFRDDLGTTGIASSLTWTAYAGGVLNDGVNFYVDYPKDQAPKFFMLKK
jgi:hypothetical protein